MFSSMFKALKRIVDNTIAPLLIALGAWWIEQLTSFWTWMFVKIADMAIAIFGTIIEALPFPDIDPFQGFSADILTFLDIAGFFPAATIYFGSAIAVFITRPLTLGTVGRV